MAPPDMKYEHLGKQLDDLKSDVKDKFDDLRGDVKEIRDVLRGSYVTQDQFGPVRSLVYGLVAVIMLAVVGAMVTVVLR